MAKMGSPRCLAAAQRYALDTQQAGHDEGLREPDEVFLVGVRVRGIDAQTYQLAVGREQAALALDDAVTPGGRWLLGPWRGVRGRVLRGSGADSGNGGRGGDRTPIVLIGLCPLGGQGRQARHRERGQQDDRAGLQLGEEHRLENSFR